MLTRVKFFDYFVDLFLLNHKAVSVLMGLNGSEVCKIVDVSIVNK